MNGNQYRSLNTDFLCYRHDSDAFEDIVPHDPTKFRQDIDKGFIQDFQSEGPYQFNLLRSKKYAKFIYLKLFGLYYAGDFTPKTNDRQFKVTLFKTWSEIIYRAFFGTVYIGYGDNLLNIEKAGFAASRRNWWDPENFPESKLRLYVMEQPSQEETQNADDSPQERYIKSLPSFRSVWTNVGGIKLNPENLVCISINGMQNFIYCWQVLDEYLNGLDAWVNYFHASLKRVYVDVQNEPKFKNEMKQYQSSKDCVMVLNNAGKGGGDADNDWEEFPAPDLEGTGIVMRSVLSWLDERVRWLGAYGKAMGQTKERKQVGETWLDHKWVNNVRETIRMKLEAMIEEMKVKFPSLPQDLRVEATTQEPHVDERFNQMHNWKGGDMYQGNHWNKFKGPQGNQQQ